MSVSWKPSTIGEVMQETSSRGPGITGLFVLVIHIILTILSFGLDYPLILFQSLNLFYFFNAQNLIGLILVILIEFLIRGIIEDWQSSTVASQAIKYLNELGNQFEAYGYTIEDYLDKESIDKIAFARPTAGQTNAQIGFVFVLEPCSLGVEIGERKGFVIPVTYFFPNNPYSPNVPLSLIFIRDHPETIKKSKSGQFYLFHEIGHVSQYAWDVRKRPYIAYLHVPSVLIWFLFNSTSYYSLLFMAPYIWYVFMVQINKIVIELDDELVADTFAIKRLPEKIVLEIEKYLRKLPETRLNNIRDVIKARFINEPFLEETHVFKSPFQRPFVTLTLLTGTLFSTSLSFKSILWMILVILILLLIGKKISFIRNKNVFIVAALILTKTKQLSDSLKNTLDESVIKEYF